MKVPSAIYRLQFNPAFTFSDAQRILRYLSCVGITDIYASPIFKARKDSQHGYDIVDSLQINPDIGGQEKFDQLVSLAKTENLGWIQDIVPNHMAFDSQNRLLMDIFENGPMSKYYQFFDIEWNHPYENLKAKMLVPFLGDFYGRCLENGEIYLDFDQDGLNIRYYDLRLPLKIETYVNVIAKDLISLEDKLRREDEDYIKFLEIISDLRDIERLKNPQERYGQTALIKIRLWKLYTLNPVIKGYMDSVMLRFNGVKGSPGSFDALEELLAQQVFRLSFWKVGNEELNYRRFFTINNLASLQIEKKDVFEYVHELIFKLANEKKITGLRIDHVDGLYEPCVYLKRLKERCPDMYIIIEKILDLYEEFPSFMPIEGTTGYDFLNITNEVFIDKDHEKLFNRAYVSFTGMGASYPELVAEKKRLFMGRYMAGDIDNLAHLLKRILRQDRHGQDMTMYGLRRAIVEIMAQFPVYRSYMCEYKMRSQDQIPIKEAVTRAQNYNPGLKYEIDFIGRVLLLDFTQNVAGPEQEQYYHFTRKFQQFSGPLMAKGAEDTAFYVYNRFISLNEVGGNPSVFGVSIEDFHEHMAKRQQVCPLSINTTSTHDTKRSEDVRARLNVLSEIPKEWAAKVKLWHGLNRTKKKIVGKIKAPDKNDEYFIYMTFLGAYPFGIDPRLQDSSSLNEHECFIQRIKEYVIKAIREAKIHTGWIKPDNEYEGACVNFVENLLRVYPENNFFEAFFTFQKRVAAYGIFNSLSQVLLKLTSPGIPDLYQGTEFWDLTLVDPDNRRPVDYDKIINIYNEMQDSPSGADFINELIRNREDGRIKLFLISQMLKVRLRHADLFIKGEYIPLETRGKFCNHIIAFARKNFDSWCLIVAPRFMTGIMAEGELPLGVEKWQDTKIILPEKSPALWENVFTSSHYNNLHREILVGEALSEFAPAALISMG